MTESKENLIKDWEWQSNNDEIIIIKYKGTDKEVTMPSVIENKPVVAIGDNTFENCSLLTNITIPDGVREIGGFGFSISGAFSGCSSLTNITIPNSVRKIGSFAFENCSSLVNITIPDSVIKIGSFAFEGCSSLVNIPEVQRKT